MLSRHIETALLTVVDSFGDKVEVSADSVVELQADGDEMTLLVERFPTFHWPEKKQSVRVFGDTAKYMFANM